MTATPNLDPAALQAGLARLQVETAEARELVIEDPDTYAAVGAVLIERLKQYDESKELRDRVTKPLHEGWKKTCALFKPNLDAWDELIRALKKALGDYDLREAERKRLAHEQARAVFAAPVPDIPAMTAALTVANAPEAQAVGVSTTFVWRVKRIVPDLLPDEYWIPDEARLATVARVHTGDDPPVIPGVVFEREAQVTGRRK
jgi:hypothetical protein